MWNCHTYLGDSYEYREMHFNTPILVISTDSYVPLTESQLNQCTNIGVVYYFENILLLGHKSERTGTSAVYY